MKRLLESNNAIELINMSFGQRLKQIRRANGYTQEEFAKLLSKSVPQYKKYESDDSSPPLNTLITIAETLKISTDELIFDPDKRMKTEEDKKLMHSISMLDKHQKEILKEITEALILHRTSTNLFRERTKK